MSAAIPITYGSSAQLALGEFGKCGQRIQALLQWAERHHVFDVGRDIGRSLRFWRLS